MNRGTVLALSAYIFWGLHPIYWKQLKHISSVEIVSNRIIWSLLFFIIIISLRRGWKALKSKVSKTTNKTILFLPAFLIGSNWACYIWAVNANYIIETSLGYFICPLVSVFLGVIFLKEKLRVTQWIAIVIAGAGVLVMTVIYGQFPWISIYLAATWGTYGLLRKKSPLGAVEGLTLETAVLSIPVAIYLIYLKTASTNAMIYDTQTNLFLIGTGVISGLPLIIFISGARLINLSLIGILQYVYPTLIFLIGAFIYHEPLNTAKIVGFIFIWTALILYTVDGTLIMHRKGVFASTK